MFLKIEIFSMCSIRLSNSDTFVSMQQVIRVILQFYLSAIPGDHLSPAVKSAAVPYIRPLSQGQQIFTPDTKQFPVGQPITKLTAKLQVRVKSIEGLTTSS